MDTSAGVWKQAWVCVAATLGSHQRTGPSPRRSGVRRPRYGPGGPGTGWPGLLRARGEDGGDGARNGLRPAGPGRSSWSLRPPPPAFPLTELPHIRPAESLVKHGCSKRPVGSLTPLPTWCGKTPFVCIATVYLAVRTSQRHSRSPRMHAQTTGNVCSGRFFLFLCFPPPTASYLDFN